MEPSHGWRAWRRGIALAALFIVAPTAVADKIHLANGRVLEGVLLEHGTDEVVLEIGVGRIGIPASSVTGIETVTSPLDEFRARASRLAADEVEGWLELGFWARDHGLLTNARKAFERVVAFDPANETAQRALGRIEVGDRWLSQEERFRELGYVRSGGEWLTPEALQARARERLRSETLERLTQAVHSARAAEERARTAEAVAAGALASRPWNLYIPAWGLPPVHPHSLFPYGFVTAPAPHPHLGPPVLPPSSQLEPPTERSRGRFEGRNPAPKIEARHQRSTVLEPKHR